MAINIEDTIDPASGWCKPKRDYYNEVGDSPDAFGVTRAYDIPCLSICDKSQIAKCAEKWHELIKKFRDDNPSKLPK